MMQHSLLSPEGRCPAGIQVPARCGSFAPHSGPSNRWSPASWSAAETTPSSQKLPVLLSGRWRDVLHRHRRKIGKRMSALMYRTGVPAFLPESFPFLTGTATGSGSSTSHGLHGRICLWKHRRNNCPRKSWSFCFHLPIAVEPSPSPSSLQAGFSIKGQYFT